MAYVRPYTRWLLIALGAVLVYTALRDTPNADVVSEPIRLWV